MLDLDSDGFLTVPDLRRIMTSPGDDKLSKRDLERIVEEADKDKDGLVNYKGDNKFFVCLLYTKKITEFWSLLCPGDE